MAAIFVNCFRLERTNQLNLLSGKDLVDLCPPIEPYQVTKNQLILLRYIIIFSRRLKGVKKNFSSTDQNFLTVSI
ncbi:MAG: hypothetical protein EWV75_03390 [Microcystis wesenbergii Mw_QC_S_20081001_S30D]|uniref:Uncharacterized protein n=1 Tax=Microcystis wesenbergii Mw_QC_S_20081001_S30D TaxID=2486245 RepID=A0A552JX23_9CHRO|nr:MAG: hypothetical protein EWV75_03390 [Microcystis wesenbergii Mw_QC_S_20081001_S30D]